MRPADAQRAIVAAATALLLALSFGALAQGGELAHRHRPARVIASDRSVDPPSASQPSTGASAPRLGFPPDSSAAAGHFSDPGSTSVEPGGGARPSPSPRPAANGPGDGREAVGPPIRDDDDDDDDDDRETVRPPVRDDDDDADEDDDDADDDDSDGGDDARRDGKKGEDGNEESSADSVRDETSRSDD